MQFHGRVELRLAGLLDELHTLVGEVLASALDLLRELAIPLAVRLCHPCLPSALWPSVSRAVHATTCGGRPIVGPERLGVEPCHAGRQAVSRCTDRRRLVLATYLAEAARPLTVVICVAIFVAVFGLVSLASQVLQAGVRSPFVWLLTGVFVVPYAVKVAQIFRALRPPGPKSRGVRVERAGAERLYALVEEATANLCLPPPDGLWIAMSFDLDVVPVRGGYTLVIGLALLDAVSPKELSALVATAVARAFTGDRISARAYRATIRWVAMLTPGLGDP